MNVLVIGLEGAGARDVAASLAGARSDTVVKVFESSYQQVANPTGHLSVEGFAPDLIVLVTDSTRQNVTNSRSIARILSKQFPGVEKIAIANKRGQSGVLSVEEVGEALGLTTYERLGS